MKWTGSYNLIEMFEGDYGNVIMFNTFDFKINDLIVVVFEKNIIEPKLYRVDSEHFVFKLGLTKEESTKFKAGDYSFSVKQYRNNDFLDTLFNGTLRVKGSDKWEQ